MLQHQFTNSITSLLPPTVLKLQAYNEPVAQADIKQNDDYEEKQDEHKHMPINDHFMPQARNLSENISDISSIASGISDSKSNIFNISQDNGQYGGQYGGQHGGDNIAPQTIKNKVSKKKNNYLSSDDSISLSDTSNLSSITSGALSLWSRNSSSSDCYNAQFYPEQYNYTHWGPWKHTVQNIDTCTIHNIIRQIVKLKNSSKYGGYVFLIQINANSQMEIFPLFNNFQYVM